MEVFCCTVHVKQQLTMDACRYYMRHNHARSWLSPIHAAITLFVTMTVILHIFWVRGLPVHSLESKILIVIAYSAALFTSIFWLFFMPRALRFGMFLLLRGFGTRLSAPLPIEITPQAVKISRKRCRHSARSAASRGRKSWVTAQGAAQTDNAGHWRRKKSRGRGKRMPAPSPFLPSPPPRWAMRVMAPRAMCITS